MEQDWSDKEIRRKRKIEVLPYTKENGTCKCRFKINCKRNVKEVEGRKENRKV